MSTSESSEAREQEIGDGACGPSGPEARRGTRRLLTVTAFWMLAVLGAMLMLRREWVAVGTPVAFALAGLPTLLGVAVVVAYGAYLRSRDELQRRIELEALALGFGAGMVFLWGWRLLERAGAPAIDLTDPTLVMMGFYCLGIVLGRRRFR